MVVSCSGNSSVHTHLLYRDQLYAAPASCSAVISNTRTPSKFNFVQREAHYVSSNGTHLYAGSATTKKDNTLLWRPFLPYYTKIDLSKSRTDAKTTGINAMLDRVLKEEKSQRSH